MISLAAAMDAPMQQTAMTVGKVPWYIFWGSVGAPLIISVLMTLITVILWKRVNRSDQNPPLKASRLLFFTVFIGLAYGSLTQWTMQEIVMNITGVKVHWKMIVFASIITGPASVAAYDLLRWYALRKGWLGLYAMISVKHISAEGDCGDSDDTDLTRMSKKEDDTVPKDYPK